MILSKTQEEIAEIRKAGAIVKRVLDVMGAMATPGTNCLDMSATAGNIIQHMGGVPSCLGYRGYPAPICISINSCVLHGIPTSYKLQDNDLVTFDLAVSYNGLHADAARTVQVGQKTDIGTKLIKATEEALQAGIEEAKPGHSLLGVTMAIWTVLHKYDFEPARGFGGHGLGKAMHEKPFIGNHLHDCGADGLMILEPGMVLAIEPTACQYSGAWILGPDQWTISTKDGGLTSHSEHTILVKENEGEILT